MLLKVKSNNMVRFKKDMQTVFFCIAGTILEVLSRNFVFFHNFHTAFLSTKFENQGPNP